MIIINTKWNENLQLLLSFSQINESKWWTLNREQILKLSSWLYNKTLTSAIVALVWVVSISFSKCQLVVRNLKHLAIVRIIFFLAKYNSLNTHLPSILQSPVSMEREQLMASNLAFSKNFMVSVWCLLDQRLFCTTIQSIYTILRYNGLKWISQI